MTAPSPDQYRGELWIARLRDSASPTLAPPVTESWGTLDGPLLPRSARPRPRDTAWADFGLALGMLITWRVALWFYALLASFTARDVYPPATVSQFFQRASLQGDALWNVWIAQHGYDPARTGADVWAFLPLYPLLVRVAQFVLPSWTLAGTLVSHLALLAALFSLIRLIRLDFLQPFTLRAVAVALLWPAALFLGTVTPDALLMLTAIGALYAARRRQWPVVALWAGLAGLTSGLGVLLMIPIGIEFALRQRHPAAPRRALVERLSGLLAIVAAPATFLAYLGFVTWHLGSPLAYFRAQANVGSGSLIHPLGLLTLLDLPAIVTNQADAIRGYPLGATPFPSVYIPALIDAAVLAIAACAGLWLLHYSRPSYGWFVLATVAVVFLIGGLPGASRQLLLLAPLYLVLAHWTRRPVVAYLAGTVTIFLIALQLFLYVNGFWVG